MAQSGIVITRLADAAGVSRSLIRDRIEELRPAGLVPKGRHGRGREFGHYEVGHLVNVLLSLAAGPADAVMAAQSLRWTWGGSESLGEAMEHMVQGRRELPRGIDLCLNPIKAAVWW